MFVDNSAIIVGVIVGVALTLFALVVIATLSRGSAQPKQGDAKTAVPNQSAQSSPPSTIQTAPMPTTIAPQQMAAIDIHPRKLLSYREVEFFKVLKKACGRRYTIALKVRLNDVFNTRDELSNELFRMYMNGHIDFLLVHPISWEPVAGVELDDSTHQTPNAHQRDLRKDELFEQAKLPLKHFPIGQGVETIRQWVDALGTDKFIEAREQSHGDEDEI